MNSTLPPGDSPRQESVPGNSSRGVLYVAIGAGHLEEARVSAASVKRQMPDLATAVFTDVDGAGEEFDHVRRLEIERFSYSIRIDSLRRTPFDRTLHVDTDTRLLDDVSELFQMLDAFDVGGVPSPTRPPWGDEAVPECFPQINGGVILYRRTEPVLTWLESWLALYEEDVARGEERLSRRVAKTFPTDQPSLRITLYKSGLRLAFLPVEYNCRFRMPGYLTGKVKIIHGDVAEIDRAAESLNAMTRRRVHYRNRFGRVVVKPGRWEQLLTAIFSRPRG
jgi:hypothetical protein